MALKAAEICATVAAAVVLTGAAVTCAILCPEAFKKETVVVKPKPTVVVKPTTPPGWGVPAYKVPLGQPYVISSCPTAIRLPHAYKYGYVVYNGNNYAIHSCNGNSYYVYNGVHYPVIYY